MNSWLPTPIPHLRRTSLCTSARKEGIEPSHVGFKPTASNHLMLLSYETLVNQLHRPVKTKSQVQTLYISYGQPLPTRLSRRLIPHHRRARWIPRPRPDSRTSNLQLSTLPSNSYTYRKTIIKHRRCPRSWTNLNHPTRYCPSPACPPLPPNPLHNRRNRRTWSHPKSHRTPMILNLWIHRLQGPLIWLLHNPNNRPPPRPLPPTRSRPSHCNPHRIPHSSNHHRWWRPPLMSRTRPRGKNRRNPWTTKSNLLHHHSTRSVLRTMLRNLRS